MTITVTISEFRNNLSDYVDKLIAGDKITLTDGRKGKSKLTISKDKDNEEDFDWDAHLKFVKSLGGSGLFTDEDVKFMKKSREVTNKRLRELDW